jgi:uncharacterized protein involved in exopolysaccharide biosynthesis
MSASEIEISWEDYLAIGLRRKRFFLAPVLAALAVAALICLFAPRVYEARALIAVQHEKLINPLIQGLAMPTAIGERLATLREEILSWSNLTRLIKAHQLDAKIPANNPVRFERLVRDLRRDIKVKMKNDWLIQVSYEGRDRAKVQEVVNSLTDIVMDRDAAIREEESKTAVGFIEAEMAVYRQKLEDSERTLREFKELYMTQMPVATALNKQLKGLELDLANLLVDNTEEHPRVIEIKRRIEEVRKSRDAEIKRLVTRGVLKAYDPALQEELATHLANMESGDGSEAAARARASYEALVESLEAPEIQTAGPQVAVTSEGTTVQMNDLAAALTLAPRQQQELVRLTRDYTVNETIYRELLEKLERAKITGRLGEDEEGGKFTIIERARFPLKPIKPDFGRVFLMALALGIALGVAAVVAAEYLDQSIQTAEEAAEFLGLPALGAIPVIVTPADLEVRRQHLKSQFSLPTQLRRFRHRVTDPLWTRVDALLIRWGL